MSHRNSSSAATAAQGFGAEAREHLHAVKESVEDAASGIKQAAQERMGQVREAAGEYLHRGRERAMELEQGFEEQVRQRPMQSICIAAGIGFLLGLVFIRR